MSRDEWDEGDTEETPSSPRHQKYIWAGVALAAVGAIGLVFESGLLRSSPAPKQEKFVMIHPLPPPEPIKPTQPPKEKPKEPDKVVDVKPTQKQLPPDRPQQQSKPASPKPAGNPAPKGQELTSRNGPGNDAYGLKGGDGGGDMIGGGGGDGAGGGGGLGFGFYAAKVQSQLQSALLRNEKTRRGTYRVVANLWLTGTGRVERVQILQSSGNVDVDAMTEVLRSLTLSDPPPPGMPEPIKSTIAARG